MIDAYASITTTSTCERNTPDKTNSVQTDSATWERKDRSILPRIQQVACMTALGDTGQKEKKRKGKSMRKNEVREGTIDPCITSRRRPMRGKEPSMRKKRKEKERASRSGGHGNTHVTSAFTRLLRGANRTCAAQMQRISSFSSLPGRRAHGTQQLGL